MVETLTRRLPFPQKKREHIILSANENTWNIHPHLLATLCASRPRVARMDTGFLKAMEAVGPPNLFFEPLLVVDVGRVFRTEPCHRFLCFVHNRRASFRIGGSYLDVGPKLLLPLTSFVWAFSYVKLFWHHNLLH